VPTQIVILFGTALRKYWWLAILIVVGLVWLIVVARVVTVKKIDDRFVWLKGINRDYLAALPAYPW